jgi:hypothetical protein
MRVTSGLGMAGASDDEPTRRGGRPRLPPIGLLPPESVPMTTAQREAAVQSLAVLLDSWLMGRSHCSDRRRVTRQPKKHSEDVPRGRDRVRQA